MSQRSEIREFYTGKNFFITGGTGFVGICLIERILRSIPDSGKLYLLMRPKKGKDISERLQEFPKNPIFTHLIESKSTDVFNKLVAVSGDVGEEDLGLSAVDRQILVDNVHVVIHSAATLDFQDNLRPTVKINLLGTRRVMDLSKQIKNLKVMIQVSSAYVNSYITDVHEKLYDAPEDAEKVIALVGTLSDEGLVEMEPKILKDHPNTYTFTKHLAEHEVAKCADLFPCTIVRPTMIVAAWKEPEPGWTCSKVGPQGFLMGAAKGVVRRLPLSKENIADYIPVDVVVNQLLVAGWDAATTKLVYARGFAHVVSMETFKDDFYSMGTDLWDKTSPMFDSRIRITFSSFGAKRPGLTIYHCSSSTQKPFVWSMIENIINGMLHKYPLKSAVWYPHLKFVPSLWLFRISAIFVHFFPGFLLDCMLRATGGKPILIRLHTNVWNSLNRLEKFIFTEWLFHNDRTRELAAKLNETDKKLFYIDITDLYWIEFFQKLHLGVRKYLNKESEKTMEKARNKDSVLLAAHVVWQLVIIWLVWFAFACAFGLTMTQSAWAAPVIYMLYTVL